MATLEEVIRIIGVLKLTYPNFGSRLTEDEWSVMPEVWHRLLHDLPFELLDAAVIHYATSSGSAFPPSVAELREAAFKLANHGTPQAEEAWGEVQKAIRRFGYYRVPEFDDPTTARAIEIIGWRALCMSENEMADRAHFFRIYAALAKREHDNVIMLPEVRAVAARLSSVSRPALAAGDGREE